MTVNLKIMNVVDWGGATLRYPQTVCYLCRGLSHAGTTLCQSCIRDLPANLQACPVCAMPVSHDGACASCLQQTDLAIHSSLCVFRYEFPVTTLIQQMKFNARLDLADFLGNCVAATVLGSGVELPQAIIPAPMHRFRLAQRGYNQAAELARRISCRTGVPVDHLACLRQTNSVPQTGLSAVQRRKNIKGVFTVSEHASDHYRHIAIVDDVVTTGSTVNEIAQGFIRAGVGRVDVWACARATA